MDETIRLFVNFITGNLGYGLAYVIVLGPILVAIALALRFIHRRGLLGETSQGLCAALFVGLGSGPYFGAGTFLLVLVLAFGLAMFRRPVR